MHIWYYYVVKKLVVGTQCIYRRSGILDLTTVFPRIVRARSINFSLSKLRAIIEGALYSRARSISNQHWLNKQMPS